MNRNIAALPPDLPSWKFAHRTHKLNCSAVQDLMQLAQYPEIISFAGGHPSPDGFAIEPIRAAYDRVLSANGHAALQYGPTEGYPPLRAWVADQLAREGAAVTPEQVLIVSGSQQGLDLLGKVLIDPDSRVLIESPSYLGALQALSLYLPEFVALPCDAEGPLPDAFAAADTGDVRMLYLQPNFQNPTGRSMGRLRREQLLTVAARHAIPVIEDDPYGELRFTGATQPGLFALSASLGAQAVRLGSFSKMLAPGLRLGYIAAPSALIRKLARARMAADLQTSMLTQMAVHELVQDGFLDRHLPDVRRRYASRCASMLDALARHFPPDAVWSRPEGGMFIWATLPVHHDCSMLLEQALARNVAFVPGAHFYASQPRCNTLRLSFATVCPERIEEGIARLGRLIAECVPVGPPERLSVPPVANAGGLDPRGCLAKVADLVPSPPSDRVLAPGPASLILGR